MDAQIPKVDNKLLFHYVKYVVPWPADSELTASASKVSLAVPGMFEVSVERTRLGRVVGQRTYYVSADGSHFLKGDPFAINDKPFEARIARLKGQVSPSIGPADAEVTLSAFEDFQCPDCADEAKMLNEQLPAEFGKQVRIVFHDYPLVQHKWAMPAAIAGRCAFRSGNQLFWNYYTWVFAHRTEIDENNFSAKLAQWAVSAKAGASFSSCFATRATEGEVKESIADAISEWPDGAARIAVHGDQVADPV